MGEFFDSITGQAFKEFDKDPNFEIKEGAFDIITCKNDGLVYIVCNKSDKDKYLNLSELDMVAYRVNSDGSILTYDSFWYNTDGLHSFEPEKQLFANNNKYTICAITSDLLSEENYLKSALPAQYSSPTGVCLMLRNFIDTEYEILPIWQFENSTDTYTPDNDIEVPENITDCYKVKHLRYIIDKPDGVKTKSDGTQVYYDTDYDNLYLYTDKGTFIYSYRYDVLEGNMGTYFDVFCHTTTKDIEDYLDFGRDYEQLSSFEPKDNRWGDITGVYSYRIEITDEDMLQWLKESGAKYATLHTHPDVDMLGEYFQIKFKAIYDNAE